MTFAGSPRVIAHARRHQRYALPEQFVYSLRVRTAEMVIMIVVGLAFAVLNIKYWHHVVTRLDDRMRERTERRYGVTIARGYRGHWKVTSGPGSKLMHFRIELLQLVYFMRAFAIWAVGLGGAIAVMALLQRLLSGAG